MKIICRHRWRLLAELPEMDGSKTRCVLFCISCHKELVKTSNSFRCLVKGFDPNEKSL